MNYTVHPVSEALAPVVECVWTLEGEAAELGGAIQSILPDGRPEVVLHLGDAFNRIRDDGTVDRQPRLLFAGQLPGQLLLQPTGRIAAVGIRLHPHGAGALLRHPLDELTGLTIDVGAVDRPLARVLEEVHRSAASPADAVVGIQRRLALHLDPSRIDPVVRAAVAAIHRRSGLVSIEQVARQAGVTRRHLERRFRAVVGLSPKRLARIVRLQRAIQMLEGLAVRNRGAVTAAECGYADQSHFVRDCRDLFGLAPASWLERRAALTGFFLAVDGG